MANGLPRVMIVEPDTRLREHLHAVIAEAGFESVICASGDLANKLLQIAPRPYVVLLTHNGKAGEWEPLLAAMPALPAHAYLLVSRQPQKAPWCWNPHTEAFVPVIPLPVDMDLVRERLAEAVGTLWCLPSHMPARVPALVRCERHEMNETPGTMEPPDARASGRSPRETAADDLVTTGERHQATSL